MRSRVSELSIGQSAAIVDGTPAMAKAVDKPWMPLSMIDASYLAELQAERTTRRVRSDSAAICEVVSSPSLKASPPLDWIWDRA